MSYRRKLFLLFFALSPSLGETAFTPSAWANEPPAVKSNVTQEPVWVAAAGARDPETSDRAVFLAGDLTWSSLEAVSARERFRLLRVREDKEDWLLVEAIQPASAQKLLLSPSQLGADEA